MAKKSIGIFIRISTEDYNKLKKEAEAKGITLYKLVKDLLEDYSRGRVKVITYEEEAKLKIKAETAPLEERVSVLGNNLENIQGILNKILKEHSDMQKFLDQILVIEQKVRSLEKRIENIEKELEVK